MQHATRAALLVLLAGCGGAQSPASEDLTASGHEAEAAREERGAQEQAGHYDPGARTLLSHSAGTQVISAPDVYNPTDRYRQRAERLEERADEHHRAAAELREYEARECRWIPTETRRGCPLLLGVTRMEDVEDGVRITFASDVDMESTVDHLRCHFAYAASEGRAGMESCALYVHGAQLRVDGHDLVLTTNDHTRIGELRRRVYQQAP